MRTPAVVCTMLLFVAAGCSKPSCYWYHPERDLERAREDYCACKRYARQEARAAVADEYPGFARNPSSLSYSHGTAPDDVFPAEGRLDTWLSEGQMYEANVFAGCMKKRGYTMVKAHRLPSSLRTRSFSMGAIAGK
ncbi:MAG: hypothetical protein JW741_07315 [Sedimentisphaerales bacterium]|nr:hypothetical protein [Sedimentisphaerales bacterium]